MRKTGVLLLAACLCLLLAGPASAATINVPAEQPTIQAAINSASAGDVIYVAAGTYYENVIVNKSVTLIGANLPVVNGSYEDDVFNVTADDVTITGFEIVASGSEYNQDDDCIPVGCDSGIKLFSVSGPTVSDNVITDCLAAVNGINVTDVTVDANDIYENYDGIHMHYISGTNSFTDNDASSNVGPGLHMRNVVDGTYLIDNNVFINESVGIHIHNVTTGSFTITDNDARYNQNAGIHVHSVGEHACGCSEPAEAEEAGIIPINTGPATFIIERNLLGIDPDYSEKSIIENAPESEGKESGCDKESGVEKGGKGSCDEKGEAAAGEKCKENGESVGEEKCKDSAGPLEALAEKCKLFLFGQSVTESSGEKGCQEKKAVAESSGSNGVGIHLHQFFNDDNNIRIANNDIANVTAGIHLHQFYGNSTEIAIENNDLTYVGAAIHVHQVNDLVSMNIDDNEISTAWAAIHVHQIDGYGSELFVNRNTLGWYVNPSSYGGIHLHQIEGCSAVYVNENTVEEADAAIHLHNIWGEPLTVETNDNTIDDARAAIHLHNIWVDGGKFYTTNNWINNTDYAGIHYHNLWGGTVHDINLNDLEDIGTAGINVHRVFPNSGPLNINFNTLNDTGTCGMIIHNFDFDSGYITHNSVTYAGSHGIHLHPFMGECTAPPGDDSGNWTITDNIASFNGQAGIVYHRHLGFSRSIITNNVAVENGCHGLLLIKNNGTVVRNNVFDDNGLNGIQLRGGTGVLIVDNELVDNGESGLEIGQTSNAESSCCQPGNTTAIKVYSNWISGNSYSGIELVNTSANLIYDNYFNQVNNTVFTGALYNQTWNVTPTAGYNILGGPQIGGNCWVTPAGDGWSQITPDADRDGFCDAAFDIYGNETDEYPLHIPYADFSVSGRSGTAPYTVTFTDASGIGDVPVAYYNWTFGDGSRALFVTTPTIQYTYTVPGIYDVTMFISQNALSNDTVTKTDWIYVYPEVLGTGGGGTGAGTGTGTQGTPTEEKTVTASDGIAKLTVPAGTQALDKDGNPLGDISIVPLLDIPKEPEGLFSFAGYAWECTPAGATFDPPITMTLTFTDEEWAALDPASMTLDWFNPATGLWETIPAVIDPVTHTVTAQISHFSVFALFQAAEDVVIAEETTAATAAPTTAAPETAAPTTQSPLVFAPVLALGAIPFLLRRK